MASTQDPFESLEDIPMPLRAEAWLPKPLHHPTDPNKIIISVDCDETNAGIYELHLVTNTLKRLHQYERDKLEPENHTHFIHPQSKTLFIFGGNNASFGAFNLETKEMKYDESHCLRIKEAWISKYIPDRNELHVIANNMRHCIFKFDDNNNIQPISNTKVDMLYCLKLLYIPCQDKLITTNMFEYALDESNKWKTNYDLKFTHNVNTDDFDLDFILGFENIIFMFYFEESYNFEIWCHHLLNNESYESKHRVPKIMDSYSQREVFVIKDGNHNAHILNFGTGAHVKVDLYKLIPNELLRSHRKYYRPLIMGYLREEENENNIPCIPVVLKTIILEFFAL